MPGSQQSARRNLAGWKLSPIARLQKMEDVQRARDLGLPQSRIGKGRDKVRISVNTNDFLSTMPVGESMGSAKMKKERK